MGGERCNSKMKLFRLALIGTGIGGIILLIVSLTSSWFGLGDAMEDTTKKTDDQRTAEEKLNDEKGKQNDLLTARIRYMKATRGIVTGKHSPTA